jgi:hypothetical protein
MEKEQNINKEQEPQYKTIIVFIAITVFMFAAIAYAFLKM